MSEPIGVGIVGLGRSGYGIHAHTIGLQPERFRVVAVSDRDGDRCRSTADELGVTAHDDLAGLLADPAVELVVVATPNRFHAAHAMAALEAGKHVLCEKPFGTSLDEVDRMLAARDAAGTVLQPFQQRRFEPDFRQVHALVASGLLGELRFARIAWHGFKRRWDWQTLTDMGGGELNNNGPHPLDHALALWELALGDEEPEVWCDKQRCLASGDAEDHVKIVLSAPRRLAIEVELSSLVAFPQDRWLICGSAGGLRGGGAGLEWQWVDWSDLPQRPVERTSTPDRSYNREELPWRRESWQPTQVADAGGGAAPAAGPALELYASLFCSIREGAPQTITPESVRRRVAVIDRCHRLVPPASVDRRQAAVGG